jgi:hypothetical protein
LSRKDFQSVVDADDESGEGVPEDNMARLQRATESGDQRAFLIALDEINLNDRSVEDLIRIVRLALETGAYRTARHVSDEGAKCYPENAEIQNYARVLAPPMVISYSLPPDQTLEANRSWLKKHGSEYRGKWVALKDGQLLASADSLDRLAEQVENTKDVLLTTAY